VESERALGRPRRPAPSTRTWTWTRSRPGTASPTRYLNWIPSAFATYKLGADTNLRFAYAHRIRRATGQQLNPFVVYQDELNVSSGNPKLKPVQTDSFEIGYETKAGQLNANLRAYYRADRDMIRSRQLAVSDTVLLTTLENGGSNRAGGLEFTLSGKLTPKLSINTSGNLAYTEQEQIDITGAEYKRSAASLTVRGRVNYQLTPQDVLQVMVNAQGKTLAGTGYREPMATLNLSYRRNLTPSLSLVMNVADVFRSQKMETITDTDYLKQHTITRYAGRTAYIGLSYRFGGVQGQRREGRTAKAGAKAAVRAASGWRGPGRLRGGRSGRRRPGYVNYTLCGRPRLRLAGTATSISFGLGRFNCPISVTKSARVRFARRALFFFSQPIVDADWPL
jgi:outer membrane receptor protein involved in Fe transport